MLRVLKLASAAKAGIRCSFLSKTSPKITFTPSCVKKLEEIEENEGTLRIVVDSGGCSGFQYKYEIAKKINEDDLLIEYAGVKVVVDSQSLQFIEGAKLDYEEELIRSGFKIAANPQAAKSCSCGSSFTLKLD